MQGLYEHMVRDIPHLSSCHRKPASKELIHEQQPHKTKQNLLKWASYNLTKETPRFDVYTKQKNQLRLNRRVQGKHQPGKEISSEKKASARK